MMKIDPDQIAAIIRDVAADKIVPRFRALRDDDIQTKTTPTDLVTIADIEAEVELTRLLKDLLPGSQVVGEEAVSRGEIGREILASHDGPVWVVDPVDGTGNFAHGNPVFGTMVALIHRGERVMSWIYQIPRRRMVMAQKGAGVSIEGETLKLEAVARAAGDDPLNTMKAFVSRKFVPPVMRPVIDANIRKLKKADTYFCCAWEYVKILEGEAAFSLYKRIEPWDHMAGILFLEEAGFYIRKWDGMPYRGVDLEGGLINAPDETLWHKAHKLFVEDPLRAAGLWEAFSAKAGGGL